MKKSILFVFGILFSYSFLHAQCNAIGGTITTMDPTTICADGNSPDPIDVALTGNVGTNSAWVITDPNGLILGLPPGPPFDLDGAGAGTCYIWHISFEDGLEGADVGANAADLMGCFDLSNPIIVSRYEGNTEGGTIATNDPTEICAGDGIGDPINVTLTGNVGTNSGWVITDPNGNILGLPPGPPFDLEGAGTGVCYIWHISFEDGLVGAAVGNNAADLQGCFNLSNPIIVTRTGVNGGDLTTAGGMTEKTICAGDGSPDPFDVILTGTEGTNSAWVITDPNGNILGLPPGPPFDLDGAGAGTCYIWHISFEDGLEGADVGNNAADLVGCYDLSNPIIVSRFVGDTDGGEISTTDPTEICAGDGIGDPINVSLTGNVGTNSGWVITDPNGNILGLPPGPPFDLEDAGTGVCYIWHISFEDGLVGVAVGNNAADLQGCFNLSNPIIVTRTGVNGGDLTTAGGMTEKTICAGDGSPDPFDVILTGTEGTNSAWVITDPNGNILGLPPGPPFDLDGAGAGTCYIWHISFEDGLEGADVGNNAADLVGCYDLSNPIIVSRFVGDTDGGEISTTDPTEICAGDGIGDPINVSLTGNVGTNSGWVITDPNGNILGLPPGPPFDLEDAGTGVCYIWHISFEDGLVGVAVGNNAADLQGCFNLSNPIIVTRNGVNGGNLTTAGGMTEKTICAGDGSPDPFDVILTGTEGTNSAWVITDPNGNILGLPPGPPFDLDGAGAGTCYIWHISFEDGLEGADVGNNAADLVGCYDLSNPIIVSRFVGDTDGGEISTTDPTEICAGDGIGDPINVSLTGNVGTNSGWVITDPNGNILGLPPGPPFDLEGAGTGVCYIWHISFEDGLVGVAVGNNAADLQGCFNLSNPIIVTRTGVNGGDLTTAGGMTEKTICAGDGSPDPFDVILTGTEGANSAWVITDPNGNILGLPPGPPFDLDGAGAGTCYIWHISFEDGLEGADVGNNAADLVGCYDLSNPIIVSRFVGDTDGGEISTTDPTEICAGDGIGDPINVSLTGNVGTNSGWVITDPNGNILGLPPGPPFDLEGAGTGVCYIWHISFEDGLVGVAVGNNAADLQGCFNLSNPIIVTRNGVNGGNLTTAGGMTEKTICAGDGSPDPFDIILTDTEGANSAWVITDPNGNILGLPSGPPFDLEGAGTGVCYIWHLSYEDGLEGVAVGNNAADLMGCFDLSNPIIVTRNGVNGGNLTTTGGMTEKTICAGDGISDAFDILLTDTEGTNSGWVITDPNGNILGLPLAPPFDLEGAGAGTCLIWHISFEDGLEGVAIGNNAADLVGCFDLSNPITVTRLTGSDCNSAGVDVELDITVDNLLYDQYEHVVYTITVSNTGSETGTGISVHAGLPDGMVYSDHDTDKGSYSLYFEKWTVGSLDPGEVASLELVLFTLVEDVNITNFVQVLTTDQTDADSTPGNDSDQTPDEDDEAAVTITPAGVGGTGTGDGEADLSLSLDVEGNEYEQYEHIIFTYTVMNDGPDDATGIKVSITEPDGFKHTGDDASTGDYSDWFELWTIPSLAAGESATLDIDFFAVTDEPTVDYFTQIFIANENDPDSTPGNDTDQVADEDDEAAVTLTLVNNFAGGATTNNAAFNNVSNSGSLDINNLFPNPATSQITLMIHSADDLVTTVNIFNLQGSLLTQETVSLREGINKFELNISALLDGVYFITLPAVSGKLQYKKFTKIN